MSLRLVIKKTVGGAPFSVNVEPDITIGALKAEVSTQAAIPAEEQRLIYKGQVIFPFSFFLLSFTAAACSSRL